MTAAIVNVFGEWHETGQWLTPVCPLVPVRKGIARTTMPLVYSDFRGRTWTIPAGWHTDGCSIPWIVLWRFDRWDPAYLRSAILHDMLFCTHLATFRRANQLFEESLRTEAWPLPDAFRRAVASPLGWWSYHVTPNLPENDELVRALMRSEYGGRPS